MQEDYTKEIKCESKLASGIYEMLESLVFAIVVVIFIFVFIAKLSVVSGDSMVPTLSDKDYLIVADPFFCYTPDNGDIVVIHTNNHDVPIVKRVIATEGQEIKIRYSPAKSSGDPGFYEVYVDGKLLSESYAFYDIERFQYISPSSDVMTITRENSVYTATATVPDGMIFAMGDNRNNSLDSRSSRIGFVDEKFILGKCVFRIMPLQKIGTLN